MRKRVVRAVILLAIAVAAGLGAATAAGAIGGQQQTVQPNDGVGWD